MTVAVTNRVADHEVTLARAFFQSGAIDDGDAAPAVLDETVERECSHGDRDTGTPGSEHLREEILRKADFVGVDAVADGQKPFRQTLLDRVHAVAHHVL